MRKGLLHTPRLKLRDNEVWVPNLFGQVYDQALQESGQLSRGVGIKVLARASGGSAGHKEWANET